MTINWDTPAIDQYSVLKIIKNTPFDFNLENQ